MTKNILFFKLILTLIFFQSQRNLEKKREREKESDYPPAYSLPKCPPQEGLSRLKPRDLKLFGASQLSDKDPCTWAIITHFLIGCTQVGIWIRIWVVRKMRHSLIELRHPKGHFKWSSKNPTSEEIFVFKSNTISLPLLIIARCCLTGLLRTPWSNFPFDVVNSYICDSYPKGLEDYLTVPFFLLLFP